MWSVCGRRGCDCLWWKQGGTVLVGGMDGDSLTSRPTLIALFLLQSNTTSSTWPGVVGLASPSRPRRAATTPSGATAKLQSQRAAGLHKVADHC